MSEIVTKYRITTVERDRRRTAVLILIEGATLTLALLSAVMLDSYIYRAVAVAVLFALGASATHLYDHFTTVD